MGVRSGGGAVRSGGGVELSGVIEGQSRKGAQIGSLRREGRGEAVLGVVVKEDHLVGFLELVDELLEQGPEGLDGGGRLGDPGMLEELLGAGALGLVPDEALGEEIVQAL